MKAIISTEKHGVKIDETSPTNSPSSDTVENTQRFMNEPFSKEKLSQLPYLDPSQTPLDIPRSVSQ